MQTKFTAGPWDIDPFIYKGRLVSVEVRSAETSLRPYGAIVASATYADNESQQTCYVATADEAMANARLLAAAPDLLEALQALVYPTGSTAGVDKSDARAVAARAAIAKAIEYTPAQEVA